MDIFKTIQISMKDEARSGANPGCISMPLTLGYDFAYIVFIVSYSSYTHHALPSPAFAFVFNASGALIIIQR